MPDFRIHSILEKDDYIPFQAQKEMIEELRNQGATWFCMTFLECSQNQHIIVLDGWKIRPSENDFNEPTPKLEDVIGFGT